MSCSGDNSTFGLGEVIVKRTDLQQLIGIAAQLMEYMTACRNGCKEGASDEVIKKMETAILSHFQHEDHWETELNRMRGVFDHGPGPATLFYMATQADVNKKVVGHLEKLTNFVNYQVTETLPTFLKMAKKVSRARVVQRRKIHFDIEPQSSSSSSSDEEEEEEENPTDQKKPKTEPKTGKEGAGQGCRGKKQ